MAPLREKLARSQFQEKESMSEIKIQENLLPQGSYIY